MTFSTVAAAILMMFSALIVIMAIRNVAKGTHKFNGKFLVMILVFVATGSYLFG